VTHPAGQRRKVNDASEPSAKRMRRRMPLKIQRMMKRMTLKMMKRERMQQRT
jgi:hypothetical protein